MGLMNIQVDFWTKKHIYIYIENVLAGSNPRFVNSLGMGEKRQFLEQN